MEALETQAAPRLVELATRVDCFTESDLCLLTDASPATIEAWRKRREGPAYFMAGNRVLYPRAAVTEWLQTRLRERRTTEARGVL